MKFKIFDKYELTYKIITYLIVAGVTIAAIYYYVSLEDKSDTFIAATLYAIFLFIVGIYLSYMEKKIEDKIYERTSSYLNLCRVKNLLDNDILTFRNAKMTIITFKVLSGRLDTSSDEEKRRAVLQTVPLNNLMEPSTQYHNANHLTINEDGFIFTAKLDKIEKEYIDLESELNKEFTDSINEYIKRNRIKPESLSFSELDLLDTNYEEWCDKHIDGTNEEIEMVKTFIYDKIESLRVRLDLLEVKRKDVENYYKKCLQKTRWNIKKLEVTYGNRLHHIISSGSNIIQALDEIKEYLNDIQREQADSNQVDDIEEAVKNCEEEASKIYSKLLDMENNIIEAIDYK